MATVRLTDTFLRSLRAGDAGTEFRDEVVTGLAVRVSRTGQPTFSYVYRLGGRAGSRRRIGLGAYPQISLADARQIARDALLELARGQDPAQQRLDQGAAAAATLAATWARFLGDSPATAWRAEQARVFARDIEPELGRRPLAAVGRGEIVLLLDRLKRHAPATANRARKILRLLYRWALERELVARDPTAGVRPPAKEVSRDRVLAPDEIRRFWRAADDYDGPAGVVLVLELVTAQRGGELRGIRGADVEGDWWTIPRERTKAGREEHRVYLTETARRLLAEGESGPGLVFPGPTGRVMGPTSTSKAMSRLAQVAQLGNVRPHDLRRTAATLMAEAGVADHVLSIVLGHSTRPGARVTRIYNRHRYAAERRDAMLALERRLLEIVGGR